MVDTTVPVLFFCAFGGTGTRINYDVKLADVPAGRYDL